MFRYPAIVLTCAAWAMACASCRSGERFVERRAYPVYALRQMPSNIQLSRKATMITLTNTSARSYGPGTLWINGAFGQKIDGLAIGQTLQLKLGDFRNEFSERFRAGGFFATEPPEPVVLAELEINDEIVRLVVVDDQIP